ncbi:hypothetical protein ASD98_16060 [Flavobacterium sp. Root186]|nr:hypothetical protein ASD98_16060 [Flavobacterium sp. Root186]
MVIIDYHFAFGKIKYIFLEKTKFSFTSPDRNGILLWSRFFNETTKDKVYSGTNGLLKIKSLLL